MADEHFDVETILNKRKKGGLVQYLVRWEGFGEDDDTWEDRKNLVADGMEGHIKTYEGSAKTPSRGRSTRKGSSSRGRSKTPVRKSAKKSAKKASAKKKSASKKSYYATRKGVKYDRAMLEFAEEYKDGKMGMKEGRKLWAMAGDGGKVTEFEIAVLQYVLDNIETTGATARFLQEHIDDSGFGEEEEEEEEEEQQSEEESEEQAEEESEEQAEEDDAGEESDNDEGPSYKRIAKGFAKSTTLPQAAVFFSSVFINILLNYMLANEGKIAGGRANVAAGANITAAGSASIMHKVAGVLNSFESYPGANPEDIKLSDSSLVMYLSTLTLILPAIICLSSVLKSSTHADAYPKWVSVGLVWCIAGDILQKVPESEDSSATSLQLVILLAYTISNFALTLAFSSSDGDDDAEGPDMHLEYGIPVMGVVLALFYQFTEGDASAAQAAFLGILGCLVWRAMARIGYGLADVTVYGSLPQWLGLTGVCSLSVAHWIMLCDFAEAGPKLPFDGPDAAMVRLITYWIGLCCIVVSVTMDARPFGK